MKVTSFETFTIPIRIDMRPGIILILICFCCLAGSTQKNNYLSGTWKGTMAIGYDPPIFTVEVNVQVKQDGRDVWAIYTIGDQRNADSCRCIGKLTATLNKKNNFLINLYQDGIVTNKISLDSCAALNYFQASYSNEKRTEWLKGKWFANPGAINEGTSGFINLGSSVNPVRVIMPINPLVYRNDGPYDGSGGRFFLKKTSDSTSIEIDKYFPKTN